MVIQDYWNSTNVIDMFKKLNTLVPNFFNNYIFSFFMKYKFPGIFSRFLVLAFQGLLMEAVMWCMFKILRLYFFGGLMIGSPILSYFSKINSVSA